MEFEMIAKTFQGLEEVLATELVNLGANYVEIQRRAVSFTGDKALLYKANILPAYCFAYSETGFSLTGQ
jgi:putative N6-adenine-specific DNA methylase